MNQFGQVPCKSSTINQQLKAGSGMELNSVFQRPLIHLGENGSFDFAPAMTVYSPSGPVSYQPSDLSVTHHHLENSGGRGIRQRRKFPRTNFCRNLEQKGVADKLDNFIRRRSNGEQKDPRQSR